LNKVKPIISDPDILVDGFRSRSTHPTCGPLVFALSISSALFLVADLSQPFIGLMQLPKERLRHTLEPLG
jgi:hypothetical protein